MKAGPLLVEERREIERFFRNGEIRRLVTEGEGRDDDGVWMFE